MGRTPLPSNESARLAELHSFDILDTLPEQSYDDITALASHICGTPIAIVSLVDQDRQWFKSAIGLDAAESPRDVAFCAHAILRPDELLIVPDATRDSRFANNPLVAADPAIRFYAGAPLVTDTGNALGTLCVIDRVARDLTPDQERALRALSRQVMAQLDLRRAVADLSRKQAVLEEMMRQKETFVATVSHELRTPLTAVMGFVEVLTDPDADFSESERSELLRATAREAGELSGIIEDLLAAARAEAGTLAVTRVSVSLDAQVAQVLEGLDPASAAGVNVEVKPVRAYGDPARVRQIVRNLLTNAFRYGGDAVTVRTHDGAGTCHVVVEDNGAGIPAADRERIFAPFEAGAAASRPADSIGLGLFISRKLAELMEGSLTYRRRDGLSIFDLALPHLD